MARRQIPEPEIPDAHANQAQCRTADGRCHPPHLPVLAFNQFQSNPTIRHRFAETDGRVAWENLWRSGVSAERRRSFQRDGQRRSAETPLRLPVAAPKPTRGKAGSSVLESARPFPVSSSFPATEFFRPAPNTRVRGRGADGAFFHSIPARRSTAATPPNRNPAARWDKRFLENQIPPACGFSSRHW